MSGMSRTGRAVSLLVVQAVLVLSVAGKYVYERKTCPRIWARTAQVDPNMPLRGRYLALHLTVDACALPRDTNHQLGGFVRPGIPGNAESWQWRVRPVAQDGRLVVIPAGYDEAPESTEDVRLFAQRPCDRAVLSESLDYFVPDMAQSPFPAKVGQELWVEVTVPPMGPPRPIQLAVAQGGRFTPLRF